MTDAILVAVIIAFLVAAALPVRAVGYVVAGAADEAGPEDAVPS
jgi:hypothetical protein